MFFTFLRNKTMKKYVKIENLYHCKLNKQKLGKRNLTLLESGAEILCNESGRMSSMAAIRQSGVHPPINKLSEATFVLQGLLTK